MGIKERRVRHKEALRQEILDAARELFVREGYANFSMRKVAESIEYSPTTIYLYFKDKMDLLYAVCEETFAKLARELEAVGHHGKDPIADLKKGLRAYVDFGLKHPQHYLATFCTLYEPGPPEHAARFLCADSMGMKAFGHLRGAVSECATQGKLKTVDLEVASRALWSGIHGVTSLLIMHPLFPWGDREQVITTVIDSMVAGLAN